MANEDLFNDAEPAKRPQYDDLFDTDPKTKAAANLRFAVPVNPDQAARDTTLAKRYNMPPAAAEMFREDFEVRAKVDDGMAVLEQRPRLRSWIAEDPERAKVAHDDLDAMGLMEAGAKYLVGAKDAPRGGLLTDVARAARAVASGAPSLSAGIYGGAAAVAGLSDQFVQALDDAAAWVTGTPQRQVMGTPGPESFFRDQQRSANTVASNWMGLDPAAGETERAVMSGFQSAGSNLLTLPAGFARNGTNIMLGLMGTSVGGQSYGKGRDAGLDPLRATGYAVQDATAEIVMERYFGAAGLLKNIKAGASAGKLFAYEVFKEVPGEVATTIWQNFNEWGNLHPDKSLADFIEEQPAAIRDTIISTLVGGTTQIGAVKGVQRVLGGAAKEEEKARQSDAMAKALDNLQKTAEASKLLERSPDNLRSYMQSLVEDDVPEVYVDSARLQEAGLDLTQLAQALPSVAEQLTEVATGGDLVIPTSELLVNSIGTEFAQALIDNARVREDAMSRSEAKAWMEAKGEEIRSSVERTLAEQEQNAEWRKNRDDLQQQILAQLNALGRFDAKVNERNALLAAQHYAVTAAQLGMTPQQLAQQYRLEWTGQDQAQTYNQQQGQDGAMTEPAVGNVSPSGPGGARIFNQGPNDGRDRRDSGDGAGRGPGQQNLSATVAGKPAAEGWPGTTRIRRGPGLGPLTVYRGAAESLKPDHFGLKALGKASGNPSSGLGVWFTTGQDEAGRYGKVEPMQLDIRNPKILRFDELPGFDSVEEAHAWREKLRKQGHDGLFLHGKGLGKKEAHIVIFEPTQAVYPDDTRFSRGQGNGIPMADAKAAVALIRKALPKAPAIHLYESLDKAPSAVVEAIEQQGAREDVEAVYHGGEIHAFPGNLESVERLMFVVGHHEVRHHGLRALLGPDLNSLMLALYENEAVKLAADEKMAAGVSSRVLAVEEALADMPADQVASLSGFDKVMAAIRQWLRKFADGLRTRGFASFADAIEPDKWTDNDVAALVSKAEDVSRYGRAGYSAGGTAFSRKSDEKDLVIQHSLTSANLLNAVKVGGLPVPSLAITRGSSAITSFGDITLLGDAGMATPGGDTKVFGADIYSPRYPSVEYKLGAPALKALNQKLRPFMEEGRELYSNDVSRVDDLTGNKAFQRFAADHLGVDDPNSVGYHDLKAVASAVLAEVGADERIFQGYTYSGNRRYIPHTLDNVVKILKKELRGGENFSYGVGSVRAHYTPQFRSLNAVRKEKNRLVTREEFEQVKKEVDDEFFKVADALGSFHPSSNSFGYADAVALMMSDSAKMGVPRALQENGFENVPPEAMEEVRDYLNKLRNLPTEYFEAKITRAVQLDEFAAAVVPDDVDPRARAELEKAGLHLYEYKRGDDAGRRAAVDSAAKEWGLYFQDSRGSVAFGEDITKTPSIISVLEKADLSTISHELGHFFWEMRFDLAVRMEARARAGETLTDGERQILDDTYRALDWLEVRDTPELTAIEHWLTMSVDEKRPYHEKLARAHEAYLFEGRAPSLELQGLFQTFRSWLLNVYRALLKTMSAGPGDIGKALNVELTDEFRQVMDRMLATAEQIAEAEAARNMGPLFQTAEEAGMTPAEYEAYQRLGIRASLDAQDELQAKSLKDLQWLQNARSRALKELQRQHDALRRDVRAQVRVEVMAQPVYQAWAFLTKRQFDKVEGDDAVGNARGLNPEVDNLFTAIAKLGGLDREAVQKAWGIDPKEKIESGVFGMPVLRKDGGLSLDSMAERLMEAGYLLPDENGKADLAKFEEVFDDQRRGTDRYSIQRDLAAAYGEPEVVIPDVPDTGYGRLRTEDLRRMYGMGDNAIWRVLSKRRMTSDDGGLSPEVVAAMFTDENGDPVFDSGDALVRALAAAEPPRDVIERLTDARMLQDHAEVAAPGALERAADIAVHNEARAKFVATELGALQKAVTVREKVPGQRNTVDVLAQAAKDYAKGIIYRKRVRDLRPAQYAAAEARAAKAAAKAKGDMVKAAEHKRNQLVNLHATKAAYQAQAEIEAALQYFRRVAKPGSVPATHHDQIMALLDKFDLSDTPLKALDNRARFRTWAKAQLDAGLIPPNVDMLLTPEQRAQFGAEVARRNEDGELIYPNEEDQALLLAGYIDEMPVRNYRDATVEEILGLRDAVRQIEHIGRRTKKVLTDRKNREFEAVVTSMRQRIEDVAEKMGRKAGDTRTPNDTTGQSRLSWRGFFFSHVKAANLLHIMDGEAGGPLWEHLMATANEAANGEVIDIAMAHDAIQQLLKPVKDLGGITDKAIHFPSIGRSLNRQARLVMALNLGNESNTQRLLGGEGWTIEQIKPVLDTLTAADWQFVQGMWDHYESYRPRVAEMERLINGVEPEWIKARPITVQTADGQTLTLRGGYAPVIYDPRASGKAASFAAEKDAKAMMQAARVASTVSKSFTKARVDEVKGRPLLLSLDAMIGAVQDTVHYLHWQPWIIDANRMIKALDEPIRTYYGAEVVTQLRHWAGDNAAGMRPARDAAERVVTNLARNISFAGLAFNVMSAVKQVTGYSQSVAVIGAKWMGRGVAHSIQNPRAAYLEAVEKSDFLKKRATTRMRDLAEVNATVQDQGVVRKALDRGGYAMMLAMQTAVDIPTWWGAYEKAIDGGKDEQTAVAMADQAVIDAQGSGLQKDLASVERATGAIRLLTGFMSFMNTTMNVNYRVLKSDQSVGAKAVDLVLVNAVPAMLSVLLGAMLVPGGEDDPEKLAKKYLVEQTSFIFGQMIGFREIAQLGAAFNGEPSGDYGGAVGTRMAADILKVAKQVGQGEMDDAMRKAVVNAAGDIFRLPSAQINRTITGTKAVVEGETRSAPASVAAPVFGFHKQ